MSRELLIRRLALYVRPDLNNFMSMPIDELDIWLDALPPLGDWAQYPGLLKQKLDKNEAVRFASLSPEERSEALAKQNRFDADAWFVAEKERKAKLTPEERELERQNVEVFLRT